MIRRCVAIFLGVMCWAQALGAQTCGGPYQVTRGDSLSVIAAEQYRNAFVWTEIYQANRALIGDDPDTILRGTFLTLPCLNGLPIFGQAAAKTAQEEQLSPPPAASLEPPTKEEFVTEEPQEEPVKPIYVQMPVELAPFATPQKAGGGMFAELITSALRLTEPERPIIFAQDYAGTNPPDLVAPHFALECPAETACGDIVQSDPMFEVLIVLFVNNARPVPMASPADMHGRVLCRPTGLPTQMLDNKDRKWLREGHIELRQPNQIEVCFELLSEGEVDAVVINEFTGRAVVAQLGMEDRVTGLFRTPLAVTWLGAAAPSNNASAQETISALNSGLVLRRKMGDYRRILEQHLLPLWAGL